uniref:TSUP family transporter n=1 Tax=uncultured Bilophila sp. TaxID=529385 RepID=UPI00280BE2D2
YLANGWGAENLPPYSLGYLYLPALFGIVAVSMFTAPIGARMAQTLPVPKLKKCFAVLLIAVGVRMLMSAL